MGLGLNDSSENRHKLLPLRLRERGCTVKNNSSPTILSWKRFKLENVDWAAPANMAAMVHFWSNLRLVKIKHGKRRNIVPRTTEWGDYLFSTFSKSLYISVTWGLAWSWDPSDVQIMEYQKGKKDNLDWITSGSELWTWNTIAYSFVFLFLIDFTL